MPSAPKLSAKNNNNIRNDFVTFLRWTSTPEANLLPQYYFETGTLENLDEPQFSKKTILTAQLKILLEAITDRRDRSCLRLAKDAGLRAFEVPRVRKKYIKRPQKAIWLPGFDEDGTRVTKTGKDRPIPMNSKLLDELEWLEDKNIDPEFRISRVDDWSAEIHEIAREIGVDLPENGLRHGYGTHRLNITQDAPRVSSEMGTSIPKLHANYAARFVDILESEAWFEI